MTRDVKGREDGRTIVYVGSAFRTLGDCVCMCMRQVPYAAEQISTEKERMTYDVMWSQCSECEKLKTRSKKRPCDRQEMTHTMNVCMNYGCEMAQKPMGKCRYVSENTLQ